MQNYLRFADKVNIGTYNVNNQRYMLISFVWINSKNANKNINYGKNICIYGKVIIQNGS